MLARNHRLGLSLSNVPGAPGRVVETHVSRAMQGVRLGAFDVAGLAHPVVEGWRWLPTAMAIGTLPFLFSWASGVGGHQVVSAILLALACLPLVCQDRWLKGLCLISAAFAAHSLLVILLSYCSPADAAALLPGAREYWEKQMAWISTGQDPEYRLSAWVPAHLQLLAAAILFSLTSLGGIVFYEGFFEVDLMNFYNAELLRNGADVMALPFGWHPWSVLRGLGFLFITFEAVSLSIQVVSGVRLCSGRTRMLRWTAGLAFLMADGLVKFALLEPIRRQLHSFLVS